MGSNEPSGPFTVKLSIGGMTCSACVTSVTNNVSGLPDVLEFNVSFLQGSAVALVASREVADTICETINDTGFEALVVEVSGTPHHNDGDVNLKRTATLRVEGMSHPDCLRSVVNAVEKLGNNVTINKPMTSLTDPTITVSYVPSLPSLSIRNIVTSISSAGNPPFEVTICHPPAAEELSRHMDLLERKRLLRRLIFCVVAAVPTLVLGVIYPNLVNDGDRVRRYLMQPMWARNVSRLEWGLFIIATPVMFYACSVFHERSIKGIIALWKPGSRVSYFDRFTRFGSMDLLVSLGVSISYFSSIGVIAVSASQASDMAGPRAGMNYFDTVIFLGMFILAGKSWKYMQAYCKWRTSDAISALNSLRPNDALLVQSGKEDSSILNGGSGDGFFSGSSNSFDQFIVKIPADHLEVGDIVVIPTGSSPPADGEIVGGQEGRFDESSLTGESRIIKKTDGDQVFVGTINKGHPIRVKVTAVGNTNLLDRIVQVVRDAQARRAPIERVADIVTGYFVPFVTLLAICTWLVWLAFGLSGVLPANYLDSGIGGWTVWSLQFAIAVFIVACPCGIGLAAPTALLVGSGLAAGFGILARGGGESFQEMSQLDLVVFDKTGTLTEGGPRVTDFIMAPSTSLHRQAVLEMAHALESVSTHPLATAIREFTRDSAQLTGENFEEKPGRGVKGVFSTLESTTILGNEAWINEHGVIQTGRMLTQFHTWQLEAKSVVLMACKSEGSRSYLLTAAFAIADPVRQEASFTVSSLQKQGLHAWLLSGDNFATAAAVASSVGIPANNVISGVLPHEKAQFIQRLQNSGLKRSGHSNWLGLQSDRRTIVAMVGDGINDAPALAAADVGIAIGSGSDVALSSASFILLSSDLRSLLTLLDLSKRIINRVKFNFVWAIVYNMLAVPVAAGVLYPLHHTRLSPVWASLAMPLSSVSVVCSSLLLKMYKKPEY